MVPPLRRYEKVKKARNLIFVIPFREILSNHFGTGDFFPSSVIKFIAGWKRFLCVGLPQRYNLKAPLKKETVP
jgi:hypothetical protein